MRIRVWHWVSACSADLLSVFQLCSRVSVRQLLQMHRDVTGSVKAGEILRRFEEFLPLFKAVISDEYLSYLKGA